MTQRIKVKLPVFILCLFGLTLITVSPVLALTCMPGGYYKETRTPCDPAKLGLPTPRNSDLGQKKQRSVGRILQKKQKNYDDQQVQRLQRENGDLLTALDNICGTARNISQITNHRVVTFPQGELSIGPEEQWHINDRSRLAFDCCQYINHDERHRGREGAGDRCDDELVRIGWNLPAR